MHPWHRLFSKVRYAIPSKTLFTAHLATKTQRSPHTTRVVVARTTTTTTTTAMTSDARIEDLTLQVKQQGDEVRRLKKEKAPKDILDAQVKALVAIKASLAELQLEEKKKNKPTFDREKVEQVCRKRFFYTPSFSIYGGVAGLFDLGPAGCALQANIINLWRRFFVQEEQMLELDTTIMTPEIVLKTSGHVEKFADWMVRDVVTDECHRADHLLERFVEAAMEQHEAGKAALDAETIKEYETVLATIDGLDEHALGAYLTKFNVKAPETGNDISAPMPFNLMFDTKIGPTGKYKGYLRPETAQGQFVNFKRLYEFNNERMPFASAMIGRSFRNEISPRSGLLRVREFTMAEIEHYVHPDRKDHPRFEEYKDTELTFLPASVQLKGSTEPIRMTIGQAVKQGMVDNETLGYFMARIYLFLVRIGIRTEHLRFRQHMSTEMAHYACDCWDAEIRSSYGWIECVGCADRSAYDLTVHTNATSDRLMARERLSTPITRECWKVTPNKRLIGMTFKKEAKALQSALDALSQDDLAQYATAMKDQGHMDVSAEGRAEPFHLTAEMLSIERVKETVHVLEYIPSVIEPSFGIGRIMYSLLEHAYWLREADEADKDKKGAEDRAVLSFPAIVAPLKCLIAPLSHNAAFTPFVNTLEASLRRSDLAFNTDASSNSIGRRYARNDEIGIPYAVTVDFQTVQDSTVTFRERDSMQQIRLSIDEVSSVLKDLCSEVRTWEQVTQQYPIFTEQQQEAS